LDGGLNVPDYKKLFTGRYLASPDLGSIEPTVKIERITCEVVKDEEKRTERERWIVFFAGKDKGMLLNRSNAIIIAALCKSDKTEDWIGHSITIGVRKVKMGGDLVDGLRVIGSPELSAPMTVVLKLPRKKPVDWVLEPTGKKQAPPAGREPGAEG
jgi:hypothetical protein